MENPHGHTSGDNRGDMPLLTTKLHMPPPRPNLVPRPRLHNRLNTAPSRRLSLICAPAGFGKTPLLAAWLHETWLPVAWVSLEANDNEPLQFWTYVIAALDGQWPGVGELALALLRPPRPTSMRQAMLSEPAASHRPGLLERPGPLGLLAAAAGLVVRRRRARQGRP